MAVYAATVTSLMKKAVKVDQVTGIGMFAGQCDVSNYNTTLAEIIGITGKFKSIIAVIAQGASDTGWVPQWETASGAFQMWEGNYDAADGPLQEASVDDDTGAFEFVAFGLV